MTKSTNSTTLTLKNQLCRSFKKKTPKKKHPWGWNSKIHYMKIGGQCGQSCPCCRARVFKSDIDKDAKWGACSICI